MNLPRLSSGRMAAPIRIGRLCVCFALVTLVLGQLSEAEKEMHLEQAGSAAAFLDSIGVQTHLSYVDTPYARWQEVLNSLVELGVRHVRDALPTTSPLIADHRQLAAAGIRCTCGVTIDQGLTPNEIITAARAASDVDALEAPNECDAGTNCGGGGTKGVAHVISSLPALAAAARGLQVPLVGPSFTRGEAYASSGPIGQWVSFNNLHVYFGGRNPGSAGWGAGDSEGHRYGSFAWWIDQSHLNAPGVRSEITETGYEAFENPSRAGTIPESVESAYLLRTLLLAWNHGIHRTFIYELLDEFPGSGYGLLRHDLSAKPAFSALRNLISLLSGSSAGEKPRPLDMALFSDDPALCHTLLQKSNGSYLLIVWLEKSGYDPATLSGIPVSSEGIRLRLGSEFGVRDVIVFNADGSTADHPIANTPNSLSLSVNDRLSVVRIIRQQA